MDMVTTEKKDRAEIALRSAADRVRNAEDEAYRHYRRWQAVLLENGAVRRNLAEIEQSLAAIENSDEYKTLRWLDARLGPLGSFRRRLLIVGLKIARRLADSPRFCAERLRSIVRYRRSDSGSVPTLHDVPAVAIQAVLTDSPRTQKPPAPVAVVPQELAYCPERWRLPQAAVPCKPLDLLVLSPVHRTGSTLLQRICNARNGTLIWGEHGGVLQRFAAIFADTAAFSLAGEEERLAYFGEGENPNLWIANMCPELECVQQAIVDSARTFLDSLYAPYRQGHDILGFKEVQYGRTELELLRKCYPKAQFLLLLRNPLDTWKSTPREWYPSLDDWIAKYNAGVAGYCDFAEHDAHSHILCYADLVEQKSKTMEVLSDVAKVSREEIALVLAQKIGGTKAALADADRNVILRECRESMEMLGLRTKSTASRFYN
jgi:hypothetical protein